MSASGGAEAYSALLIAMAAFFGVPVLFAPDGERRRPRLKVREPPRLKK
jgi:hypothetical protein